MAKYKPRRAVLFAFFRLFSLVAFILPLRIALVLGKYIGGICFYILARERERALGNLDIAFGSSKSEKEKYIIAREVFENLGKNFIEVASIPKFNRNNINRYISCEDFRVLQRFIEQHKGLILLSAHFGNWELLAHYVGMKGVEVNVVARRVRMEGIERFLDNLRKKNNINVLYRDESAKEIVGLLRNNKFVAIMPDQDMDSVAGMFVDFFGKKAYTATGPAVLSFLTGVPILPCFMVRQGFGHRIFVEKLIEMDTRGDRNKDILELTERYTKIIEDYIRKFPSQWVWFHERWKTKP